MAWQLIMKVKSNDMNKFVDERKQKYATPEARLTTRKSKSLKNIGSGSLVP